MSLVLSSPEFQDGQPIPTRYTCDGENISVPLQWSDAPANSRTFALIVDDPDAPSGTYTHWVLYNMPATVHSLAEHVSTQATLADGSMNGMNSARKSGYTGPCPPGGTHHYHFKLYALDATLTLKPGATKDQLSSAMQGHIVAQTELIGTYRRNR